MIPAKLLGLLPSQDSIILRAGDVSGSAEVLSMGLPGGEDRDAGGWHEVLRGLIAMRRRGEGN